MTIKLSGQEIADIVNAKVAQSVVSFDDQSALVKSDCLHQVMEVLKTGQDLEFNHLIDITSVDYFDYFEVVYHITSIRYNRSLVIKTRAFDRENPAVPSLVPLWKGAELMEREVFDLMGISFNGHPDMRRIFLWEGFKGHPLRKDYL